VNDHLSHLLARTEIEDDTMICCISPFVSGMCEGNKPFLAVIQELFVRALAIYEQQVGPEHPLTATSLNNLALL
jgi:hypothetical protein